MHGNPPPDPSYLPTDAKTLDRKLCSLRSLDSAIHKAIRDDDYQAAQQFAGIAREHALEALAAALKCMTLPLSARSRFSADAIQHAERVLGIEPDTFASFFAVNLEPDNLERRKALKDLLENVDKDIRASPVDEVVRTPPSWLPAIIRICSAVLVATAVGAPLSALAVGESVVKEVVKAGIAVTACVVVAEMTNHAVERWLKPPGLAEAIARAGPTNGPGPPRDPSGDGVPEAAAKPDPPRRVVPTPPADRRHKLAINNPGPPREPTGDGAPEAAAKPDPPRRVLPRPPAGRRHKPTINNPAEALPDHGPGDQAARRQGPTDPTGLDEPRHGSIDDPFSGIGF